MLCSAHHGSPPARAAAQRPKTTRYSLHASYPCCARRVRISVECSNVDTPITPHCPWSAIATRFVHANGRLSVAVLREQPSVRIAKGNAYLPATYMRTRWRSTHSTCSTPSNGHGEEAPCCLRAMVVHAIWVACMAPGAVQRRLFRPWKAFGQCLTHHTVESCHFCIDAPASNSGRSHEILLSTVKTHDWSWTAETVAHADEDLVASEAVVASADRDVLASCTH
ncbi:MAG: hypothetical protein ACI835_001231 [Planctomycetota bacterium]|jgi:hypothetical protein